MAGVSIAEHRGVRSLAAGAGGGTAIGVFASAPDAVAAALALQQAAGAQGAVRVALDSGPVTMTEPDRYGGPVVGRAARLAEIAHAGQILLSDVSCDLVAERLSAGVTLRHLGSHRLKDLGAPERVWQLCHPALAADFPPLRSLAALATNLPIQLTSFVGRGTEIAAVLGKLRSNRLVTLTGAGGVGKSPACAAGRGGGHWPCSRRGVVGGARPAV
jgi:hypothetical protein